MGFDSSIPLGKETQYQFSYNPKLLFSIARQPGRDNIGIDNNALPFIGIDRWTAYELSWLNERGQPVQAVAEFDFACDAPNIVESKSFKLYLNSFNQSHFANQAAVLSDLSKDLTQASGKSVAVALYDVNSFPRTSINDAGLVLDTLEVDCSDYDVNADLLVMKPADQAIAANDKLKSKQRFCFDGFRSLCPVTSQPDWASVTIELSGADICPESLLKYLVSYRNHQGFHEQCVEQIFYDLSHLSGIETLTVFARFLRRGGLDINPIRTNESGLDCRSVMPVIDRQ